MFILWGSAQLCPSRPGFTWLCLAWPGCGRAGWARLGLGSGSALPGLGLHFGDSFFLQVLIRIAHVCVSISSLAQSQHFSFTVAGGCLAGWRLAGWLAGFLPPVWVNLLPL